MRTLDTVNTLDEPLSDSINTIQYYYYEYIIPEPLLVCGSSRIPPSTCWDIPSSAQIKTDIF